MGRRLNQLAVKTAGLLGSATVRLWMSTLDYRVSFYDPTIDPIDPRFVGPKIFIFWHEYILFPLHMRGNCNLAMLLSQHRDADILTELARHLNFEFVRGSTSRGGVTALRELLRKSKDMNLTITPDGPRGPRRVLAQGPVYLSSKLGLPIVAMGFGYNRPWRLNSWDRFAIPRPHSRARAVVSPQMVIPPNLDRDGIEHYRVVVERMLNRLTCEAEAWAEAGTAKVDDTVVLRQPSWRNRQRAHRAGPSRAHVILAPSASTLTEANVSTEA
jgi:lysophospholipid acyltransferase (LPLAT)-like uncharacterized protein